MIREPKELLDDVVEQLSADADQAAVTTLMIWVEERLRTGFYNHVDQLLGAIDVEKLSPACLLGVLTVTYHASSVTNEWSKDVLPRRAGFLERAEESLRARIGDDRTERLLRRRR